MRMVRESLSHGSHPVAGLRAAGAVRHAGGMRLAVAISFPDGERDLAVVALDGRVLNRIAHPGDDQNPQWIDAPTRTACGHERACLRRGLDGTPASPQPVDAMAPSR